MYWSRETDAQRSRPAQRTTRSGRERQGSNLTDGRTAAIAVDELFFTLGEKDNSVTHCETDTVTPGKLMFADTENGSTTHITQERPAQV